MQTPKKTTQKKIGLSKADLNAALNPDIIYTKRIEDALKQLGSAALGQEEFRALAKLSAKILADYAPRYAAYRVAAPVPGGGSRVKNLWCGTTKFAAEVRSMLELPETVE